MKPAYWLFACGTIILLVQYGLYKEDGQPRYFEAPSAVQK